MMILGFFYIYIKLKTKQEYIIEYLNIYKFVIFLKSPTHFNMILTDTTLRTVTTCPGWGVRETGVRCIQVYANYQ